MLDPIPSRESKSEFLRGGGEMGARMRALDWSRTPLGDPAGWPQSLRTVVRVMLDSRFAMWMLWGPDLTFFCNDAYLPTVGIKRDWVLGARSDKVWEEIWPDIGPRIRHVLEHGQATWDEGLLLFPERSGFTEETYHTFSYSPVYDDQNRIAGMLCVVTEVSERVIGERRLQALRDLATRISGVQSVQAACERLIGVLGENARDVPFACLYLLEAGAHAAGLAAGTPGLPQTMRPVRLSATEPGPWPIAEVLERNEAQIVSLVGGSEAIASAFPGTPVSHALVLPVPGQGSSNCVAVLIAGISPRRALDDNYRGFFELVARQFAADIADAQAYEAERRRAEALAEIDKAKTAFFSNVSHEFRTPLTLMLGPIETAVGHPETPPWVREQLLVAQRNSLRLLKLVNSLLDFSRIEAGRVQASFEPTDVAALTADLASSFRSAVEGAGLSLRVECEPIGESVYLDREMWEKIVLNLLSNAFKFTFSGEIAVQLRREGAALALEVSDTGVGIPHEEIPRLFERFHRVESTQGRTQEGSGIGLALVQELVKLHGGRVEVESEPGRGTRFWVRLHLGSAHLAPERIKSRRALTSTASGAQAYVQEALRWIPEARRSVADLEALEPVPLTDPLALPTAGARIIIADDNADMRAYLSDLLAPRYRIEPVADGEAALAAARRERPDLVLTDVMMPRLDGFALLKALRADESLRSIPVVVLSARAGEEARIEGLRSGADEYLAKPFSARELTARIAGLLELARLRREGDRQKNEFLAMLAHELRNPLAPIRNAGELLARIGSTDPQARAVTQILQRQANVLARLVDDLLDVSRITQGRIMLKRELVKLADVLTQATETVEPLIRERNHRISVVSHRPLRVTGDFTRLVQCVVNVLTNAAKYTQVGGDIKVELSEHQGEAVLAISDNGPGISAELLPHVFELFVQSERTLDRAQGGLGIGLSLVKRLIEMHEGRVTALSAGPGSGATFEIRLPLATSEEEQARDVAPSIPATRILVVDDNADAALSLEVLLKIDGHEVEVALTPGEALSRIRSFAPEVVLLDIGLPDMDGYEVARRIRSQPQLAPVRLVALTGYGQSEDRQRVRASGFDDHLVKPVDYAALQRALQKR